MYPAQCTPVVTSSISRSLQSPFQGFIQDPFGQLVNTTTQSDFEAYVKNSFWHTKMGNDSDLSAVVDSQLNLIIKC